MKVFIRQFPDFSRHGCREERSLTGLWGIFQDRLNILDETHTKHFVSFIQDDHMGAAEIQCLLFD